MIRKIIIALFGDRIKKCMWVDARNVTPKTEIVNIRCGLPKYGYGKPFISKSNCAFCSEFKNIKEMK